MPESRSSRGLWLLLAGYIGLLLVPAGFLPLMESTEGRYGEIAWEMVSRGRYLEPVLNGIKHFHKPPLAYWAVAAGYQLFGIGDFGARFFGVLAAGLAVYYLYRLALLVFDARGPALDASLIFASSLLFLAVARIVATDIYLTAFTVMAQFYLFRRLSGVSRRRDPWLCGLALGLGFLTKGPVIFLFTLLPFLVAKLFDPAHRRVFSWQETGLATLAFALVALPWYLAVALKNPGLLHYFLKAQTVDRAFSNRFRRYEPPWYFLYIFAGTFVPYLLFLLKGACRPGRLPRPQRVLFLYLLVPFVILSLVPGKQPTYILPGYGVASILAAAALLHWPMPRLRVLAVALLALAVAAPAVAGCTYPPAQSLRWPLLGASVLLILLWWQAWRARQRPTLVAWCAALLLGATTAGYAVVAVAAPQMRGYETMARALDRLDPGRKLEVLVYRGFLPSLSLYRRQRAVMAFGMHREVQFQDDTEYRRWYLESEADLRRFLAAQPELFVVARREVPPDFLAARGYRCRPVYAQHKHTAYRCLRLALAGGTAGKERSAVEPNLPLKPVANPRLPEATP